MCVIFLFLPLLSHSETYGENGYCKTDQHQELNKCLAHNLDLVQKQIDELSKVYRLELEQDGLDGFEDAQAQWEEYADSTCKLHSESAKRGSAGIMRLNSCKLYTREKRVIELGCMISYHMGDGNQYQHYCIEHFVTRNKK